MIQETQFYEWISETNKCVFIVHYAVHSEMHLQPEASPKIPLLLILGVKPESVDMVGKSPIKALNCELAENCELVQGWGTYRHACNPARLRLPA